MNLQLLYGNYLNIKYNHGLPIIQMDDFEYGLLEDDRAPLFFIKNKQETFLEWAEALQPQDPYYIQKPDWKPMIASAFNQLDVYDEQIFSYLLYTINSTTAIISLNRYNMMNDFMKQYCFFQLSQLASITMLNDEQKHQLRDFFFFFYLYAHPVNEETLYSFSFKEDTLIHSKTTIQMVDYFSQYHDYIFEHYQTFKEQLLIAPYEIKASKKLSLALLRTIEGKNNPLTMPHEDGIEVIIQLINDLDYFLHMYKGNKASFFQILKNFLHENQSNPYREHCFSMVLQNFATYILYFEFDDLYDLLTYFHNTPLSCKIIVNKIIADSIFMQKIMKQSNINIHHHPTIIQFFDDNARAIYLG